MAGLGIRMGSGESRAAIVSHLGKPNESFAAGSVHLGRIVPQGYEHLVYWWRGGHDYLYFIVRGQNSEASRWWYAGE